MSVVTQVDGSGTEMLMKPSPPRTPSVRTGSVNELAR